MPLFDFQGKTALVTGGNSGIGRAAAIGFARQGARVLILARNAESALKVVSEIEAFGGSAFFYPVDVSEAEQVDQVFKQILRDGDGFDMAFNNAGVSGGVAGFDELSLAEFNAVVQTNLYGIFHCMKAEVAHFLDAEKSGAIVNCASVSALVGAPYQAAYCASKHAVVGLTKSAALEYAARNIRINAVCPGGVMTPMLKRYVGELKRTARAKLDFPPIGRSAEPEEVANLVLWLCSSHASYMVGQAIAVDGGFTVP